MESAWSRSLFSFNRKHVKKTVKLFLNPLEDCRGTFRGTFSSVRLKHTFQASDPPDTGHRTPDTGERFIQAIDSNARFKRK